MSISRIKSGILKKISNRLMLILKQSTSRYQYLFTSALGMSKIKYERNGQDFPFTKRLDNQSFGKKYELGIHIITESQAKESLRAMSLQRDDLVVLIPDDDRFYKDNRLYLQTDTYVKQNSSTGEHQRKSPLSRTKAIRTRHGMNR